MRRVLPVLIGACLLDIPVFTAQTTPPPSKPAAPAPRTTAPAPAARGAARPATLTIEVTDATGAPLGETQVTLTGPVMREGVTGADGRLRLTNMRAGNYRVRFTREGSITLERDFMMRATETPTIEASLSAAPSMPPATNAPPAPAPNAGNAPESPRTLPPPGDPKVTAVPLFLEKNFIGGRERRKDSILGCTSTAAATLHQLREAWTGHVHEDADEWIYVVAGEGTLRIGSADQRVQAGTFSLVPHAISHALQPQGRNPLIVISVLSGPSCQG
jgi:mannose-6-phosphate isomerase-like protein (cupin superfamily)